MSKPNLLQTLLINSALLNKKMLRTLLVTIVFGSIFNFSSLLVRTPFAFGTTITVSTGTNLQDLDFGVGDPPLEIFGIVPTGTAYFFNAHPPDFAIDIGFKRHEPFTRYEDDAQFNEIHGTTGEGRVRSFLIQNDDQKSFTFTSFVEARIKPGNAENLPVSMTVALSDPLTIGPEFTNFSALSLDVFLKTGTKFDGVPNQPDIADNPTISLNARVAPGEISDPFDFFDDLITDAIDLYNIEIEQSNSSELIESTVSLGASNSLFSLSFSDSNDVIEQRVVSAFSGNVGNYEVLNDQFLFNLDLAPRKIDIITGGWSRYEKKI